jgi:hypothetical protein
VNFLVNQGREKRYRTCFFASSDTLQAGFSPDSGWNQSPLDVLSACRMT